MIKGFERTKGIVRLLKLSDTHRGGRASGQAVRRGIFIFFCPINSARLNCAELKEKPG